jgi:hypothetical protein
MAYRRDKIIGAFLIIDRGDHYEGWKLTDVRMAQYEFSRDTPVFETLEGKRVVVDEAAFDEHTLTVEAGKGSFVRVYKDQGKVKVPALEFSVDDDE